mmetsp:Transcript_25612/g.84593  ORF Transcript_25612/g.84593 Transcript_25612/m.84593 type:complete len:473 (-) Transcript_25612:64-1482(-)
MRTLEAMKRFPPCRCLLLILMAGRTHSDEFMSPTHSPCIQILRPIKHSTVSLGEGPINIRYASPRVSLVNVYMDGTLMQTLTNLTGVELGGITTGAHTLRVELLNASSEVAAVLSWDEARFTACDCGREVCWSETAEVKFLPALENPLLPDQRYMHHDILYRFGRWVGRWEEGYLLDWLGVRTRTAWDCIPGGGYYMFVPSRRMECEYHEGMKPDANEQAKLVYPGFLPPVDDEYPEYVDMLKSVYRSKGQHYVVVELGSSYGTWAVRACAAARRLYPEGSQQMIAVESSLHRFRQLEQHVQANNVWNYTLLHAYVTSTDRAGEGKVSDSQYSSGDPEMKSLVAILDLVDHVDYLDFDIQGAEMEIFRDPLAVSSMNVKVKALHVGTHSLDIHENVKAIMIEEGWTLELDLPYHPRIVECDKSVREEESDAKGSYGWLQRDQSCFTYTDQGPMYVRDGLLSFYNPNFAHDYD